MELGNGFLAKGELNLDIAKPEDICYFALLVLVFVVAVSLLLFTKDVAPYGRMMDNKKVPYFFQFFPEIDERLGWVLMELPSTLFFAIVYFSHTMKAGSFELKPVSFFLFLMWQTHYFHRTFLYPFLTIRNSKKGAQMNALIPFFGFIFNSINSYLNATLISKRAEYPTSWFRSSTFFIGVIIFYTGYYVNRSSDTILRKLRNGNSGSNAKKDDDVFVDGRGLKYMIPYGGMYRFVSCPNYLGETMIWSGWAIATWSLAGLSFALFTIGNLWPRAVQTHKWYLEHFPRYPKERKAVIPFLY